MPRPSRCRHGLILALVAFGILACTPSSATGSDGASVPGAVEPSRRSHSYREPAIGEIRLMANDYRMPGRTYGEGQSLSSAQFAPLFDVLGTRYGGDGKTSFALPSLVPVRTANGVELPYQIVHDGATVQYEGGDEGLGGGTIGEVRRWPGERVPAGWLPCDGRELPLAGHEALFAVIGTSFGGDGQANFKLPKLDADQEVRYLINLAGLFPKGDAPLAFASEIGLFAGSYLPAGWAPCDGQIVDIQQNQSLFALLGSRFGGNGKTTYALPRLTFEANPSIHYAIAVRGIFPVRD